LSAIDRCLEQNRRYAESFVHGDLTAPPAMQLAVVCCMDARMQTGAMLGLAEGGAHVIRNAGGVVTDDVIRSLTISQRLLGTREVMLIMHTRCGMLGFDGEEFRDSIAEEIGERPQFPMLTLTDLEAGVRESLERLKACRYLPHRDAVRGFIYDVESGLLHEID